MGKSSVRALVALGALMVVAACSSSKGGAGPGGVAPVDLSVKVTDAPTTGALAGTVVDENGAPIAGATVNAVGAAGTVSATTDGSGAFSLAPTPGRVQIQASAKGKVPVSRTVGVTSTSPALRLKLVTAGAAQTVTAAGGTLKAGVVTLTIPSGAYPSGGTVAATWIDRAHVSGASGHALFVDDVASYRFVGQLAAEASAEPLSPSTLHVPVPEGLAGDETLVLFATQNGEMVGGQFSPTGVAKGVADFTVPHFSMWTVMRRQLLTGLAYALAAGWVLLDPGIRAVTALNDAVKHSGPPSNLFPDVPDFEGADIAPDTTLDGSHMVVGSPTGAVVYVDEGPVMLMTGVSADGHFRPVLECVRNCNVQAEVPTTPAAPSGENKLIIKTVEGAEVDIHGTVVSLSQQACSQAGNTAIDRFEVAEGESFLRIGSDGITVVAGKQVLGCDGCKDPKQTVCDCDVKACGDAGGVCLVCPGEDPHQDNGSVQDPTGHVIRNCVPSGTVCCNGANAAFISICVPYPQGPAICQCAGSARAACATPNSVCVPEDSSPPGVFDCTYATPDAPCDSSPFPGSPPAWACRTLSSDVQNCGACGNTCPGSPFDPSEVCYAGACHSQPCKPGGVCYNRPSSAGDAYTNFCSPQTMSCQCKCCTGADCGKAGVGTWNCPPGCM